MASNNSKMMIPVPQMGLREDVDRSVSDPNMLVSGENVVSVDRTVRPRPCHRMSNLNGTQGLSWATPWNSSEEGYDAHGISGVGETGAEPKILLSCRDDGTVGNDAGNWPAFMPIYSEDGATWEDAGTAGLASLLKFGKAFVFPAGATDYLFAWGTMSVYSDTEMSLGRANYTTFAADPAGEDLNFSYEALSTNILGIKGQHGPSDFVNAHFDDTNDFLYGFYRSKLDGTPYLYVHEFTNLPTDAFGDGYVVTFAMPTGYTIVDYKYLLGANGLIWLAATADDGEVLLLKYTAVSGGVHGAPDEVYTRADHGMDSIADAGMDITDTSLMLVGDDFLVRLVVATETFTLELVAASADFKLYDHDGTNEYILGLELYRSSDAWTTFSVMQTSPSTDQRDMAYIEYSGSPGIYDWYTNGVGPDGGVNIYDMPDDISVAGDCTNIFQIDLATEPYAIFNGTSEKILKFNRASGKWENLSYGVDSDSANYPDSSITIPGVLPNDSYYMQGSREFNPTIFRSFEQGGYTWVLASNGIFPPVMWNTDLDEFEPILYDFDPPPGAGDIVRAPVASTMAVVGNRLLLGNVAGSQGGYGVTFSIVNDHTQGWDIDGANNRSTWTTYALLGDTPGRIVSIQEITALAAAVYKEDAIYHAVVQAEFLGQNAPFRFELIKSGISGPASQMAIVRMLDGRQAYLANDGGVYVYDGVNPTDVGRHVRAAVQKDLDQYHLGLCWGMMDPYNKLLWFFYPTQNGRTNRGLILQVDQPPPWPAWRVAFPFGWDMAAGGRLFNFSDKSIGSFGTVKFGDVPDRLGDFASGLYEMSIAKADNTWYVQKWSDDGDYTDGSIPIDVNWTQGWEAIEDPFRFATAQECQHIINSDDPDFELGFQLQAEQANVNDIELDDIEYIGPNSHYSRTTHRLTGKRFSASFRGHISRAFRWGGLGMYYYMRGLR